MWLISDFRLSRVFQRWTTMDTRVKININTCLDRSIIVSIYFNYHLNHNDLHFSEHFIHGCYDSVDIPRLC